MGLAGALLAWNGAGRPPPRAIWRALRRQLRSLRGRDGEADALGP